MVTALCVLYGLSLALSISGAEIFGALLIVFCLVRWLKEGRPKLLNHPLTLPILVFVLWRIACTLSAGNLPWQKAFAKQSSVLVFFLAAYGLRREEIKKTVIAYCVGAVVACLWGISEWIPLFIEEYRRADGPRSHPLTFAETIFPAIFILLGAIGQRVIVRKERMEDSWKELLGLFIISLGLVASESRGVWLGASVGFFVLLFFWPRKPALVALALLTAMLVLLAVFSPQLKQRARVTMGHDVARETRFELWHQTLATIRSNPAMGVGIGGIKLITHEPKDWRERIWTEAHSIYLQAAAESGLIGLGLLLWIFLLAARLVSALPGEIRSSCLPILIAFLVAGLTESWLHDKEVAIFFWAFLGAASNLKNQILA